MARVIKAGAGGGTAKPARPATRMLAQADLRGAIKADVVLAKQEAEELLRRADDERRQILADGKRQAALVREEAATRAAAAAFAQAAEEALVAFRKRADRYGEAADDIRILALAIAKKVLGTEPDLSHKDVERILQRGLQALRAKRKVRVQVSPGRRAEIAYERPHLMKAVNAAADLLLEDADDVREGYARVVTEVGGSLCAEESALDAVALAVNVKEIPRQRRAATGRMRVGGSTGDESELEAPTGKVVPQALRVPDAPTLRTGQLRTAQQPTHVSQRFHDDNVDDDQDDQDDLDAASLPDAAIVEDASDVDDYADVAEDAVDDDQDATRALPARVAARDVSGGGFSVRPSAPPLKTSSSPTAPPPTKPPAPRVEARGRAATRVVAELPEDVVGRGAEDDDDLDLFTDARPQRR